MDPARIRDLAGYDRPHQLSEGIESVLVNGIVTVRGEQLTGDRNGRFLDT
jgi:N-acyl-D-aspartate/D-glutamate deacylase